MYVCQIGTFLLKLRPTLECFSIKYNKILCSKHIKMAGCTLLFYKIYFLHVL